MKLKHVLCKDVYKRQHIHTTVEYKHYNKVTKDYFTQITQAEDGVFVYMQAWLLTTTTRPNVITRSKYNTMKLERAHASVIQNYLLLIFFCFVMFLYSSPCTPHFTIVALTLSFCFGLPSLSDSFAHVKPYLIFCIHDWSYHMEPQHVQT